MQFALTYTVCTANRARRHKACMNLINVASHCLQNKVLTVKTHSVLHKQTLLWKGLHSFQGQSLQHVVS